jgi:hypothetical protein
MLLLLLALAACQSAAPPAADDAKPMTYGDWTVKQGGYVRVEAGAVR